MTIWIDADACPKVVKEHIYKTSQRLNVPVVLVANSYMRIPSSSLISIEIVEEKPDEADRYILNHSQIGDIAISSDIPLASDLVDKGVVVISPHGILYTENNVKEALATRDLMSELREGGLQQGGSVPFSSKDKERFANSLNRVVDKCLKGIKVHS